MLSAATIYQDATVKLIVVTSAVSDRYQSAKGSRFFGHVEPVAIVVCRHGERFARDMSARPTDLAALADAVPGLAALY